MNRYAGAVQKPMSWVDEICLSCGVCCTSVSIVRIQPQDIERLRLGYNLTSAQAHRMVRRDPGELRILMEKTAACPALSSKGGRYLCHAYEHRPGICREYECYILEFAKDWMKKRSQNQAVEDRNPFHLVQDEEQLARQVQESVRRLRSNFLNLCVQHGNEEGFRKPDYMAELIQTLSGAEFENAFPPGK